MKKTIHVILDNLFWSLKEKKQHIEQGPPNLYTPVIQYFTGRYIILHVMHYYMSPCIVHENILSWDIVL